MAFDRSPSAVELRLVDVELHLGGMDSGVGGAGTSSGAFARMGPFLCGMPPSAIQHSVSHKLTDSNYALWKSQFTPLLNAFELMGLVDGTYPSPPPLIKITKGDDMSVIHNPDYLIWHKMDQLVLSWFVSSISEEIGSQLIDLVTARDVWVFLENTLP